MNALSLVLVYVENVVKNPSEPKFRRIKSANKAFQERITSVPGAVDVLVSCGFQPVTEGPDQYYTVSEDDVKHLGGATESLKKAIDFGKKVAADSLGQLVTLQAEEAPQIEEVYRLSAELAGHTADVRGVAVTSDGGLATAGRDKTVRVWPLKDGDARGCEGPRVYDDHGYAVASVTCSAEVDRHPGLVVSGSYDLTSSGVTKIPAVIKVRDRAGTVLHTLEGHKATVSALAVTWDGARLVSGSWDKTARVWDLDTGACVAELAGHTQAVWAVLPLPGGRLLTGSADRSIRLWDDGGKCLGQLSGHSDCVRALALLPDGRFASGSNDGTVRVWSIDLSGNSLEQSVGFCLQTLVGHDSFVYALAALPNGDLARCAPAPSPPTRTPSSPTLPPSLFSLPRFLSPSLSRSRSLSRSLVLASFLSCSLCARPLSGLLARSPSSFLSEPTRTGRRPLPRAFPRKEARTRALHSSSATSAHPAPAGPCPRPPAPAVLPPPPLSQRSSFAALESRRAAASPRRPCRRERLRGWGGGVGG